VADITYIAIATGFVYLAAVLDAWSRRVIGYAISRSIDARVAVAALKAALLSSKPDERERDWASVSCLIASNYRPSQDRDHLAPEE
jgi:transposase InsO family protein